VCITCTFLYILYLVSSCIVLPFWRNKVYKGGNVISVGNAARSVSVCLSVDHNREPYKTAGRTETLFGVHVDSCAGAQGIIHAGRTLAQPDEYE